MCGHVLLSLHRPHSQRRCCREAWRRAVGSVGSGLGLAGAGPRQQVTPEKKREAGESGLRASPPQTRPAGVRAPRWCGALLARFAGGGLFACFPCPSRPVGMDRREPRGVPHTWGLCQCRGTLSIANCNLIRGLRANWPDAHPEGRLAPRYPDRGAKRPHLPRLFALDTALKGAVEAASPSDPQRLRGASPSETRTSSASRPHIIPLWQLARSPKQHTCLPRTPLCICCVMKPGDRARLAPWVCRRPFPCSVSQ